MQWIAYSFLASLAAIAALGIPAAFARRTAWLASGWLATALALVGALTAFTQGPGAGISFHLAILPALDFTLSPLRALFIAITAVVFAASIAAIGRQAGGLERTRERGLLVLATLLQLATIGVLISASVLSLVFTWELMSLCLWALVNFKPDGDEDRRAGYVTLALSEAGSLAALAGLLILSAAAGSTSLGDIAASAHQLPSSVRWLGFVLTFFGFGVKTGLVPVNAWVAPGYAAAPHSLRPVFSGATMNLGIFTFLVIDAPLAIHTTGIGLVAMVVGALTAILGIVYALIERDIAKLLAQSSVENLGIVVAALGAGCAFASLGKPVPAGIALIAGVYHMLNHSAFKTLLFLGAGGIGEATGSRDLDRLGGLLRRLPVFGTLFLAGTMAIAALPPLNGFVSEWLVLESLLRIVEAASVPVRLTFAVSGALLALTAGLALTCFTLVAGTSLLGLARSPEACNASRVPASATVPMACLAFTCLALGVLATAVIPVLGKLVEPLAGVDAGPQLVPSFFTNAAELPSAIATDLAHIGARVGAGWIPLRGLVVLHSGGMATPVIFAMSTALSLAVIALIAGIVWLFARGLRRTRVTRREVWDAGLPKLRPEMTYNATAFSSPVRVLFNTLLRPAIAERVERQGAFAMTQIRETRIVHVIDRLTIQPLITGFNRLARWLAAMHHGRITAYAGYVLVVLGAALLLAVASL